MAATIAGRTSSGSVTAGSAATPGHFCYALLHLFFCARFGCGEYFGFAQVEPPNTNNFMNTRLFLPLLAAASVFAQSTLAAEEGFAQLFDGKTLNGWTLVNKTGRGYVVEDGRIICPKDGGGNLFTEK